MQNTKVVLIELAKKAQEKTYKFRRIYRYLCNPEIYEIAYARIYKNKGSATAGVDKKTADSFNKKLIENIINELKDESYQSSPLRRVGIPKKNGGERKLGIPTFKDRLIQEACKMILETIFEPIFTKYSHGYREEMSCHTALSQIQNTFTGVNWFIEGDIKGCFDNIDHHILIELIKKRVEDERFIRLLWKMIKSGHLENSIYYNTFSGTPQGGIISPLLANIYLHELDIFVTKTLKEKYQEKYNMKDRKKFKVLNPEYQAIRTRMLRRKKWANETDDNNEKEKWKTEYKQLLKIRKQMPYLKGYKGYYNFHYIRYADDFIIGVSGDLTLANQLKNDIKEFTKEKLKLELSEEKTYITHSEKGAKFLNYGVRVRENNKFFEAVDGRKQRSGNRRIVLECPQEVIIRHINDKKVVDDINSTEWRGKARTFLQNLSDLEIITVYNAEIRGLYNYYCLAENVSSKMHSFHHVMEYSCLKTLAGKHKSSVAKIRNDYRIGEHWGVKYKTVKGDKTRYFYKDGFSTKRYLPQTKYDLNDMNITNKYFSRSELERRMAAKTCEMCGKENIEMNVHHINKMKNLKNKESWEILMSARNRKTLIVCEQCHKEIHKKR